MYIYIYIHMDMDMDSTPDVQSQRRFAGTVYKAPSLVDIFDGALCQSARAASSTFP